MTTPTPADAAGGGPGHLHDLPGQQHRQRRDPGHPARPAPDDLRAWSGSSALHPGVRQPAAGRRPARRRLGPQAAVPDRAVDLHRGLAGGRAGRQRRRAGRQPRGAGPRRRAGHADHAGDHHRHLHRGRRARRARSASGARRRRARAGGRPAARRRCSASTSAGAGSSSSTCRSAWPPWRSAAVGDQRVPRAGAPRRLDLPGVVHLRRRAVRADLRADRGSRPGLDLAADPGRASRSRPARRCAFVRRRAALGRPDGRRCRCSASGSSPAAIVA